MLICDLFDWTSLCCPLIVLLHACCHDRDPVGLVGAPRSESVAAGLPNLMIKRKLLASPLSLSFDSIGLCRLIPDGELAIHRYSTAMTAYLLQLAISVGRVDLTSELASCTARRYGHTPYGIRSGPGTRL